MTKMTLGLFVGRDLMSYLIATDLIPFFSATGHQVEIFISKDHEKFVPENREFKNYLYLTTELLHKTVIPLADQTPESYHFWAPTPKQIQDKFGFSTHEVDNINSQNFIKKLSDLGINCALNIGFEQKFKKPLFSYFDLHKSSGGFCLNLHLGWLPYYRGVLPLFRSMLNEEKYAGLTLHHLEDNTQTGAIVHVEKYSIDYSESIFTNLINNYGLAVTMILNQILDAKGKTLKAMPQSITEGNYYTYPTSTEVSQFLSKGWHFFDEDSVLGLMAHIFIPPEKQRQFYSIISEDIRKLEIKEQEPIYLAPVIPLMAYRQKRAAQNL